MPHLLLPDCDSLRNESNASWHWYNVSDANLVEIGNTNLTCLSHAPELEYSSFVKVIVLAVMSFFSLVGNAATIYSIGRNRRKRHNCSAIYTLILHLSIADLFVTVFCISGEAAWHYSVAWIWGNAACKIFKFSQMFSLYLSTFVLVLIGIDRFVAVRYPMKSLDTAQKCGRLIIFTWILSFVLSIPQMVIFRTVKGPFIEEFHQCVTYGFYTEAWQEQVYAILTLFFMFLLPLGILLVAYISTVVTIAKSEKIFKDEIANSNQCQLTGDLNRRRLMHRAKIKSLRISIVIVAAFVICWTPYYILMIILMFLNLDKEQIEGLQNWIFFFGMSNSLVNPLIYGAFHLWPRKKQERGSHRNSTTQHRSTVTHASFMLTVRNGSAHSSRQNSRDSNRLQGSSKITDETVLTGLMEETRNNNNMSFGRRARLICRYNSDGDKKIINNLLHD